LQPLAAYLAEAQSVLPDDEEWVAEAESARSALLDALRGAARGAAPADAHDWEQRLKTLKRSYVARYTELHGKYVLGPAGDDRRRRLTQSPSYAQVRTLGDLDLFGSGELGGWDAALAAIQTCRAFHQGLLADSPVCPHCRFRPLGADRADAEARLETLQARLDTLLDQWHRGLRAALASATAQDSQRRMTARERRPIEQYLALADPQAGALPDRLVESVNQALRGLQTVTVQPDALAAALRQGGLPCTVAELEQRFRLYVQTLMRGHDEGNTRLTIE
jgi:hypothetical protein